MTDVNSDAEAFLLMKKAYLLNRGPDPDSNSS